MNKKALSQISLAVSTSIWRVCVFIFLFGHRALFDVCVCDSDVMRNTL